MLLSRGALGTARYLLNGKGRPWEALKQRNFSSLLPPRPTSKRPSLAFASQKQCRSPRPLASILSHPSIRFASTTSSSPPLSSTTVSTNPAETTIIPPGNSFLPDEPLLSDDALVTPLQEKIGFLHELGIDYGWGPTSTIQWVFEHVYVYSGFGWGPSIMLTAIIVRIALAKLYYNAADMAGKMSGVGPQLQQAQRALAEAKRLGDQASQMEAMQEMRRVYKRHDIKFIRIFLPLCFQLPIGFATFRLYNGMSDLPVPGMEMESFLWLQDLTVSDPFLILPLATSAAFYFSFKFGGELGTTQNATSQAMRLVMQYVLPIISGVFMSFWPAALQISFFTSSTFSLVQSYLFRKPGFRKLLRMSPLIRPVKPAPTSPLHLSTQPMSIVPEKKGVLGGAFTEIKGAVNQLGTDAKRKLNESDGLGANTRLTRRELKDAQAYELRRRREIEMQAERKKKKY